MAFVAVVREGSKYEELWLTKSRSKGVKPYRIPLPYTLTKSEVKAPWRIRTDGTIRANYTYDYTEARFLHEFFVSKAYLTKGIQDEVHNKALAKLEDKINSFTNFFEAWYERKEAISLLLQCVKSVHTFVTRWRDRRYWRQMRKSFKTKVKDPASLPEAWLLWQFALKPLIGTIDDIINLLSKPFPAFWMDASSSHHGPLKVYDVKDRTSSYPTAPYRPVLWGRDFNGNWRYTVKHGVEITAVNPNAMLAEIMGATTPISTYLSVVPWFWAVNYFVNVTEVVSNIEDRFPGITIGKTYTTTFHKAVLGGYHYEYTTYKPAGRSVPNSSNIVSNSKCSFTEMKRTVGSSVPKYRLNLSFPMLGSSQAANLLSAIALTLKGVKK